MTTGKSDYVHGRKYLKDPKPLLTEERGQVEPFAASGRGRPGQRTIPVPYVHSALYSYYNYSFCCCLHVWQGRAGHILLFRTDATDATGAPSPYFCFNMLKSKTLYCVTGCYIRTYFSF